MKNLLNREILQVEEEIKSTFKEPLDGSLKSFLFQNSKRIRTQIALLYFKAQGFNFNKKAIKVLACGEILHNASLLHDDVIDCSEYRRGEQALWVKQNPQISILSGDYLVSYAVKKLVDLKDFKVIQIFQKCIEQMCLAEILQNQMRGKIPDKDTYLEICTGKTGSLFSAILESTALLFGANVKSAKKFGEIFGLYFQIKNDLEQTSAEKDRERHIYTAKSVFGIENSNILLDNLKEDIFAQIGKLSVQKYKERLKDLVENYDR